MTWHERTVASAPARWFGLDATLPELLAADGDARVALDPATGLNKYHCGTRPRPEVLGLGSCTASHPTEAAFRAGEALLSRLRAGEAGPDEAFESLRGRLLEALLGPGPHPVEVAFCPSGTDAELLALALAGGAARRAFNLVIGPEEVGSGTVLAARGRHFTATPPFGPRVEPGVCLAGFEDWGVTLDAMSLRTPDGDPIAPEVLEPAIAARLDAALQEADRPVLLHLNAGSKTGLVAPRVEVVRAWRARHGDRLHVVVDAAQGRFDREDLATWLEAGFMVIVTGSKFFAGPAFSGALLVPRAGMPPRLANVPGLSAYMSRAALPLGWTDWREGLPGETGPGLLLRWELAMASLVPYLALPRARREAARAGFAAAVDRALGASPAIRWAPGGLSHARPTIFSFSVHGPEGPLDTPALRGLHRALGGAFQVGQPVDLGGGAPVLRVALGAPLALELAGDDTPARLAALEANLGRLARMIEDLARAPEPAVTR